MADRMAWVFGKGVTGSSAAGAGGAGTGVAGGEAQENMPDRMMTKMASGRSKALNGRRFIFTIVIVYNRLESGKSGYQDKRIVATRCSEKEGIG
jgi:hypothetical protein